MSYRYGPTAWRQVEMLGRQRACMRFVARPDDVVFAHPSNGRPERPAESPVPPRVTEFYGDIVTAPRSPRCDPNQNLLFAGPLTNGHGRRLVIVELYSRWGSQGPLGVGCVWECARTVRPAGPLGRPRELWYAPVSPTTASTASYDLINDADEAVPVTVHGGRVDPAKPSDFVARFTIGGQAGALRGHLADDDHVTLRDESPRGLWRRIQLDRSILAPGEIPGDELR